MARPAEDSQEIKNRIRKMLYGLVEQNFQDRRLGEWIGNDKQRRNSIVERLFEIFINQAKRIIPPNAPYALTEDRLNKYKYELKRLVDTASKYSWDLREELRETPLPYDTPTKEEKEARTKADINKAKFGEQMGRKIGTGQKVIMTEGEEKALPTEAEILKQIRGDVTQALKANPYDLGVSKVDDMLKSMGFRIGGLIKKPLGRKFISKRII